jgi:hypothetical protein
MADTKNPGSVFAEDSASGAAWAALLSAGIGGLAVGLITDVSECSPRISKLLVWYHPAGALSGVAICAIIVWLISWAILHICCNGKTVKAQGMLIAVISFLAAAAVVTTFPPFYELLGG